MPKKTPRNAAPEKPETVSTPCAYLACAEPAILKTHTATGWAPFCKPHYHSYHGAQAREHAKRHGLLQRPDETRQQWIARQIAWMKARPIGGHRERVPGEDDE